MGFSEKESADTAKLKKNIMGIAIMMILPMGVLYGLSEYTGVDIEEGCRINPDTEIEKCVSDSEKKWIQDGFFYAFLALGGLTFVVALTAGAKY